MNAPLQAVFSGTFRDSCSHIFLWRRKKSRKHTMAPQLISSGTGTAFPALHTELGEAKKGFDAALKPGNSNMCSNQHYKWLQWRQKIAAQRNLTWNPKGIWCLLAHLVKRRQRLIQPKLNLSTVSNPCPRGKRLAVQGGWGWMRLCSCTRGWIQIGWAAD